MYVFANSSFGLIDLPCACTNLKAVCHKPLYKKSTILPYLGANYPLKINKEQAKDSIDLVDGKFEVMTKSLKVSPTLIKRVNKDTLIVCLIIVYSSCSCTKI